MTFRQVKQSDVIIIGGGLEELPRLSPQPRQGCASF